MTFSYNISDTGDVSSQMRREIGDTRLDDGILPDSRNFSDEELDYFYAAGSFWEGVARAFDAAAAEWSRYPESMKLGPEFQKISAAAFYRSQAAAVRSEHVRRGAGGVGSRAVTRSDGYSQDVDNMTV